MPETVEQLQQIILPLIQNQQLDTALGITQKACENDPENADKWLLQASIHSYKQNMPMLENCCQKAIMLQPQHVSAHYNLAVARQIRGDLVAAEKSFNSVIQLQPQHANAHVALAQILRMQHRFEEALKHQQQALSLMPDNPQLNFQIAVLYQNTRQIELAMQHYKEVLKVMPENPEALNNLGSLYHSQGQPDQSMKYFGQALKIQPNNAQLHYNLSQAYWQLANIEQSFLFALSALQLQEDSLLYRQNFIQSLATIKNIPNSPEVIKQIEKSYNVEGVGWQNLLGPSLAVLRQQAVFSRLREVAISNDYDFIHRFINADKSDQLLKNKLLLHCLTHTVITFEHDERLFTLLRRALLSHAIEKNYALKNHQIALIAALACQCFNNEYAFALGEDETRKIDNLTALLSNTNFNKPLSIENQVILALFAMYQPLYTIKNMSDNSLKKTIHHSEQWSLLIERQLTHAKEEQKIMGNIETLTQIEDQTSKAVQDQYEDSPYPRWLSINLTKPRNYLEILQSLFPHFKVPVFSQSPLDLLIAGCGTGSHSTITSKRFSDVNVLAIDLSRHSIAYAQRMANKYKINNLKFAQADILGLKNLDKRFHIIESVGVLHHMKNPEDGLKVLRDLLHEDGLINLGFYSSLARRHVTESRKHFQNRTPTTSNIRQARQEIFSLPKDDPMRTITSISDFYSLSDCRDLIFHTQERCYNIKEIKELVSKCGLKFIGFELPSPSTKKNYMEFKPDDIQFDNLDNWAEYEALNPDTFIGMYTFWCQRSTS